MLFALTSGGLFLLTETGTPIPGAPYSQLLSASYIGVGVPYSSISLIVAIPGLGLYGYGTAGSFSINETTGAATALPTLANYGPIITGLAYDPDSGQLIGASGSAPGSPGPPVSASDIYDIDPLTGQVTLLNSDAPDMFGITYVSSTPEPSSIFLLAAGILGLWLLRLDTIRYRPGACRSSIL
jgi:hypothetical protein